MKNNAFVIVVAVALLAARAFGSPAVARSYGPAAVSSQPATTRCVDNPDPTYERQQVLLQLASILSKSIPWYKDHYSDFYVKNGKPGGFEIWDLTEPAN